MRRVKIANIGTVDLDQLEALVMEDEANTLVFLDSILEERINQSKECPTIAIQARLYISRKMRVFGVL